MPRVPKNILILISGILWSGVGLFLIKLSTQWYAAYSINELVFVLISGLLSGVVITYFGFSKIALKNIERISQYGEKVCIWAFQKWTSYFLIAFMMSLGLLLRNSPNVSKVFLGPIYIGIGFALFTSSLLYYRSLLTNNNKNDA